MIVIRSFVILVLFALVVAPAFAVTPPTPAAPVAAKLQFDWILPTTRTDGAPLAANEIAKTRIYVTSFDSVIDVAGQAKAYTYTLPAGVCVAATDNAQATVVDTEGRESAASAVVKLPALCGPKPLPAAPTSLRVSAG
jgi:hypothetical protein